MIAGIASQIMRGGFSAGQATALNGTITSAISGAGTIITDATNLTTAINLVSTAAASSGVQLPAVGNGDSLLVFNDNTGNSFYVYPDSATAEINNLGVGNGMLLATNTAALYVKISTTKWVAFLSA